MCLFYIQPSVAIKEWEEANLPIQVEVQNNCIQAVLIIYYLPCFLCISIHFHFLTVTHNYSRK